MCTPDLHSKLRTPDSARTHPSSSPATSATCSSSGLRRLGAIAAPIVVFLNAVARVHLWSQCLPLFLLLFLLLFLVHSCCSCCCSRSQRALPHLNCKLQIAVGTPRPPGIHYDLMSEQASERFVNPHVRLCQASGLSSSKSPLDHSMSNIVSENSVDSEDSRGMPPAIRCFGTPSPSDTEARRVGYGSGWDNCAVFFFGGCW